MISLFPPAFLFLAFCPLASFGLLSLVELPVLFHRLYFLLIIFSSWTASIASLLCLVDLVRIVFLHSIVLLSPLVPCLGNLSRNLVYRQHIFLLQIIFIAPLLASTLHLFMLLLRCFLCHLERHFLFLHVHLLMLMHP